MPVPVEPSVPLHTGPPPHPGTSNKLLITLLGLSTFPVVLTGGFAVYQLLVIVPHRVADQIEQLSANGVQISPEIQTVLTNQMTNTSALTTQLVFLILFVLGMAGVAAYLAAVRLSNPIHRMVRTIRAFASGNWLARANLQGSDELSLLAHSFNRMANGITTRHQTMQAEIQERTLQIRTASEVGELSVSVDNLEQILTRLVGLLVDRFGYYHVSVFLMDPTGEFAVLKDASGEIGEQLKAAGYRLDSHSNSMISWVIQNNQPRIAQKIVEEPLFIPHDLLPGTHSEASIPIAAADQVVGVLDVHSQEDNGFDADTIAFLQTIARQIASSIVSTGVPATSASPSHHNLQLSRASSLIAIANSRDEVIRAALTGLKGSSYKPLLLTLENDRFHVVSGSLHSGKTGVLLPDWIPMPSLGIDRYLVEGRPTIIPEINSAPSGLFNLLSLARTQDLQACALFPIRIEGHLTALLMLMSSDPGAFSDPLLQPYQDLVQGMNAALQKITAAVSLQRRLKYLETLTSIGHAISLETDLTQIFERTHQHITEQIDDVHLLIAQVNPKTKLVEIPYIYEGGKKINIEPFPLGAGLTSHVIRTGQPLMLVKDTEKQALALDARIVGQPAKSWLGVPLQVAGQTIGAIAVQDIDHEERFTQDHLDFLLALAPQIAVSMRNAQLLAEMQTTMNDLDQERSLLATLMENVPDRIYFKNRAGRFIRASQSTAAALKISDPGQMIGTTDFDYFDEDQATQRYLEEQELIRSGQPEIGRIEQEIEPGSNDRWWLTTRLPLRDRVGQPAALFTVSREITDLKVAQDTALRRAEQLRTASEIARDTSGTLDLDDLLRKVVNLVRDRFNFYHASIFLVDPGGEMALLKESTGEAGRQLKANAHQLPVGSQSIVGQATGRREVLVVNDVTKDPTHLPNPLLPDTRAEMAIPMVIAGRLLGALDVQSTQKNAFTSEDVSILQILTDQLATAVTNAQLFAETQDTLAVHRLLHHITTAAASSSSVDEAIFSTVQGLHVTLGGDRVAILLIDPERNQLVVKASAGYEANELKGMVVPVGEGVTGWVAIKRQPLRIDDTRTDERYMTASTATRSELAVPLIYRDQLLGVLNLESEMLSAYAESDQEMFATLGSSLAAIIANAGLIEQVRKQVDRQNLLYEVTSRIRRSVDVETILKTSANEINRALGARQTHIRITAGKTSPPELSPGSKPNGKEPHS